ncbi:holin [Aquibacillus salsiterrae]|uniref:Holin n=1 Tax=Aquibacillus salsiterrae TaxID=2950439 RepID=A0A9X4AHJ0_9BACI|nr:holin [Aquibacillus salsiterrae]MDC3418375.1 holin [Aquibacillus salsiterrae]
MEQVLSFATVLTPIVSALVQLVKKTVTVKKNYLPLGSFLIGIVLGILAYPFADLALVPRIWAGGVAGLAATGLFELVTKREGSSKDKKIS